MPVNLENPDKKIYVEMEPSKRNLTSEHGKPAFLEWESSVY